MLLRPRQQKRPALKTLLGPKLGGFVVLGHGRRVGQNDYPGLFGRSENVDVGWQTIRFVESSDAHEAYRVAGSRIVTPNRDLASGAAGDPLALAAVGWRVDDVDPALQ